MIEHWLSNSDYEWARSVAETRIRQTGSRSARNRFVRGDEDDAHVLGACGELVLARVLGLEWQGAGWIKSRDVGEYEVRTRSQHWYDLPIRDEDDPNAIYWLVTGQHPGVFRVWGWILAKDGRRPEWRKDYGGYGSAWFVPRDALRPIYGAWS